MDTITLFSVITVFMVMAYLFISREKTTIGKTPSNFGIIAIGSMIIGIIIGYRTGSGWAYALIAHGMLGLVIEISRKMIKKKLRFSNANLMQELSMARYSLGAIR